MAKELKIVGDKVEMFDRGQRAVHWAIMVTVLVLMVSGLAIYIHGLFGEVTTATWWSWHATFSILLIILVLIHTVYDSIVLGRFWDMWLGRDDLKNLATIVKNFLGITKKYPKYKTKFPTLQKVYHWTATVALFVLIITGLILWEPFRLVMLPFWLFGGWDVLYLYYASILHQFFTFILVAIVIGHLYFAIVVKVNWSRLKAMFTGYLPFEEYKKKHIWPVERETASKAEERITSGG